MTLDSHDPDDILAMARWLHEEYERIAADVGWETQEGTSTDFGDLPAENKEVMVKLASALLSEYDVSDRKK